MTYNILAKCYSETSLAKEHLYTYCPPEYLDFMYRRTLLVHEILSKQDCLKIIFVPIKLIIFRYILKRL